MKKTLLLFVIIALVLEGILAILWVSDVLTQAKFQDYSIKSLLIVLILLVVSATVSMLTKKNQ